MNVHHLELFYYVARYKGISRALPHMPFGIQQPAVSSQIIRLETELDVKLFERRPFALTAPGERLYRFIHPFFGQLSAMKRAVRQDGEFLRIGAGEMMARNYLPQSLGKFRREMPEVSVSLKSDSIPALVTQVQSDELDLAILPISPRTPQGLTQVLLLDISLALVVPKNHPAKTAKALVNVRTGREPLISLPPGEPIADLFQMELVRRDIQWLPDIELSHLVLVESYVESGLGVGLAVNLPSKSKKVKILPLLRFPKLRVAAYYKGTASSAMESLLDVFRRDAKHLRSSA